MKKLRLKRGFTLVEVLIATLLLGFVSIMVSVMTSAVLTTTTSMQEVSQAEILGAEALENIQNELRFGTNIVLDVTAGPEKGFVTFNRQSTKINNCMFEVNDEGVIVVSYPNPDYKAGEAISETNQPRLNEVLFGGVSYGNLKIANLSFSSAKKESIDISVSISYGEKIIWSGGVSCRPISGNITVKEA